MEEYGEERKKIIFDESGRTHAEFKIKLQYDGLGQGEFFREIVSSYLKEDPHFMEFLNSMKERLGTQQRTQREVTKRERTMAKKTEKDFRLTDDEVDNIFDLLEKETNL